MEGDGGYLPPKVREVTLTNALNGISSAKKYSLKDSFNLSTSKLTIIHDLTPMCHSRVDGITPSVAANDLVAMLSFFKTNMNLPNNRTSKHIPSL